MYEYLLGTVVDIKPTYIVLDVMGVGYLLNVANPYTWKLSKAQKIFVHQVVREDAHMLYGFTSEEEKTLFLQLISVSGIGPKSALAIIAADDSQGLMVAIDQSNVRYLTKFPGVGNKTASQMVLDLRGKFVAVESKENQRTGELSEAVEALSALGYKQSELKKVASQLESEPGRTAEEYIKMALRILIK